ncbi:uncharacterized protein LOC108048986 [Drosophila rhopaloa]|uniref:Uncharacterized protein LOC108048986 n=1 Tax=Drosophila rhopaloa TaxID=1041015 RepID=A0A6P4FDU3_DRORH|nr:uncharacterized protein LOC108048986 [Drosophila rhopaloa]XP_016985459.1 uncharacterized protein LOC108048986 [Drosophila rhopaloa]
MSSLRRSHGGGRDFLQENKQNVSRMETNGRCLAAANARRVPLWRPVVLHYAEKLRPRIQNSQRRPRQSAAAHEASNLRSGLAQPYGFRSDQRRRQPPNPCGCDLDKRQEQERLQGGWEDQRREKERAPRKCCHGCPCHQNHQGHQGQAVANYQGHQGQAVANYQGHQGQTVANYQGHQGQAVATHQGHQGQTVAYQKGHPIEGTMGHQAETLGHGIGAEVMTTKQGEGDQADHVSLCSRMSRLSRRSQRIPTRSQENTDPEAPLSARSGVSAKTLKSKRSVSQETVRSNATIKSNSTVASRSTTASKRSQRSQVSRKSQIMEIMPPPSHLQDQRAKEKVQEQVQAPAPAQSPPVYEGYTPLTENERSAALQDAHFKYGKLVEEYNHMPVSEPTLRVRNRKIAIERELDQLDYAINMFDQPHLDMYYKK